MSHGDYRSLANYRHFFDRLNANWDTFLQNRSDRLRHGSESEKVAEAITEDLLTGPLDWCKGDLEYQKGFADIVLSKNSMNYIVIEVKRPGAILPGNRKMDAAIEQAWRYAREQQITAVSATDGRYFYAADLVDGGLQDRMFVDLASSKPPEDLWWISEHGIYRRREEKLRLNPLSLSGAAPETVTSDELLDSKHKLPARCFAYVGDPNISKTWKLPYRTADGHVDAKRLPKAIQALLSNYMGKKVKGIPESAVPHVLKKLADAAIETGHLSPDGHFSADIYQKLASALEQHGINWKIAI